jgi:alpha-beta hydrolase superfamily lysophospholipase
MSSASYYFKVVAGTAAALVLGSLLMRLMDEEHDYARGVVSGAYRERKQRFAPGGETHNWFDDHFFLNKDGLAIFYRRWLPSVGHGPLVKGVVVVSHGLGEHSGRYHRLASLLAGKGYAVYALDHQGHGQSEGTRVHVKWFGDYVADVHQLTELAKSKHAGVDKVFLLGHSMGALIAIHSAHDAPRLYNGVVLSAPPISRSALPPGAAAVLPTVASLLPKAPGPGLDLSSLCRDKSVVDRYHNDPLNNMGPLTVRLLSEVIGAMAKVDTIKGKFATPFLLMHGTDDLMCLHEGSVDFHKSSPSQDKKFVSYKDAYHELFNEPGALDTSIAETLNWLEQRQAIKH